MSAGTRARLSPGEQLRGEGRPLSVTGCLLFKEWDPEDRRHYFWEEWQLSGMDDYDTWVELDHYDGRVYLYEPLRFVEQLDKESGNTALALPNRRTDTGNTEPIPHLKHLLRPPIGDKGQYSPVYKVVLV